MNGSAIRMLGCIREPCFRPRVQIVSSVFERNVAYQGGAIYADDYHLRIRNSTFLRNTAIVSGGAIFVKKPKTKLVIRKSIFTENNVTWDVKDLNLTLLYPSPSTVPQRKDSLGGAICALNPERMTLSKCTFHLNRAPGGGAAVSVLNGQREEGGEKAAVFNVSDSVFRPRLQIVSSVFERNLAYQGGAIYGEDYYLIIHNSTFLRNTAIVSGGAIFVKRPRTELDIRNSIFTENNVTWDVKDLNLTLLYPSPSTVPQKKDSLGGAICALNPERMTLSKCTFHLNRAPGGGAAVSVWNGQREEGWEKAAVFNVSDSVFSDNSIQSCCGEHITVDILESFVGTGGAISHVVDGDVPLQWTIQRSQFLNNAAVSGGGLYISGAPMVDRNITDCIFKRNSVMIAGGSILARHAHIVLTATNISEGIARGGGGLMIWHGSSLSVQEDSADLSKISVISNNTALYGGGILLYELDSKIPSLLLSKQLFCICLRRRVKSECSGRSRQQSHTQWWRDSSGRCQASCGASRCRHREELCYCGWWD